MGVEFNKLEEILGDLKEDLKKDFNSLKEDFSSMKEDFNSMKKDFNSLKEGFNNLESKVEIIDLTQRNSLNLASNYVMDGIDYSPTLKSTGYRTSKKEMTIKI